MVAVASAQNSYDAADFAGSDLNGTARYVGMGGALSALGGDISTMGSNPAGTAMFHRDEVAFTVSGIFTDTKGQLGHDATRASFDQAGVVFSLDQDNSSNRGLQYINFGVNYVKHRNHLGNFNTPIANLANTFSQTFQIADLANAAYDNDSWGMLPDFAAPAYDSNGNISKDGILIDTYDNAGKFLGYEGMAARSANYRRAQFGSTTEADFNISFNVSDKYFWGVTLGVYDIDFTRESFYEEMGVDGNSYDISNWYETSGEGFDVKLGFICRPIDNSPFRFGITINTPIWYSMEDQNGATMYYTSASDGRSVDISTNPNYTDPYQYTYSTPWKFGFSLGHTIGNYMAIGAEYELADFSHAKYESRDWSNDAYFQAINDITKASLTTQSTFKLGLEVKPAPSVALRCGYNYVSSPYKNESYRTIAYDSPFTETDYCNWKGINRFTLGVGYRFNGGYFDLAYQFQYQKGDFYAFDDVDLRPTEIENNRSQIMATLGFRF